jgi:hypothetical protein
VIPTLLTKLFRTLITTIYPLAAWVFRLTIGRVHPTHAPPSLFKSIIFFGVIVSALIVVWTGAYIGCETIYLIIFIEKLYRSFP